MSEKSFSFTKACRTIPILVFFSLIIFLGVFVIIKHKHKEQIIFNGTIPVIIDTDIGQFTDDVGALAILHSFMDDYLALIGAVMANDCHDGIVPAIDALNNYLNHSDIPIGITKDPRAPCNNHNQSWTEFVVKNYPHPNYNNNSDADDAVKLYRKVLSDPQYKTYEPFTIVSIGTFINLANLLDSGPDDYSPLNGTELVNERVKRIVAMAGQYPSGTEWNIQQDVKSAKKVFDEWPTDIVLIGFESGDHLLCGTRFLDDSKFLLNSPIRKAWELIKEEPFCFDELAAWIAVHGPDPYYKQVYGEPIVFDNGTNSWNPPISNITPFSYLEQIGKDEDIINEINPLLER